MTRVGPYELGDRIGAGGMGSVFRAVDTRSGQEVGRAPARVLGRARDRAQLRQRQGDLPGARADLDLLLGARPDDADALALRGSVRRQLGDDGGLDDLRRALELRPDAPWAQEARDMVR